MLLIILLEIPFCQKCCPVNETVTKIIAVLAKNEFRGVGYLAMSVWFWLSVPDWAGGVSSLVANAILLTVTGLCYCTFVHYGWMVVVFLVVPRIG